MKRGNPLKTLKFIFVSVVLFVLTFTAVVITMLNVYSPKFIAKINEEEVAYFSSPADFDETYEKLKSEKKVDGVETLVYLSAQPKFELRYVRNSVVKEQNQYTNLREFVKAEYTTYTVYVKDNKEMNFATKKEADSYAVKIKNAVKSSVKSSVIVKKETSEKLSTLTNSEVAKAKYSSIVSRYKQITRKTSTVSGGIYYLGGSKFAQKASGQLNTFIAGGIRPTTGIVTQNYGPSSSYSNGIHTGIDIASMGHAKVNIYSYKSGTVVKATYSNSGYGNCIVIYNGKTSNGEEVYTLYAHLSSINVSVGQSVAQSTKIGNMGTTGYSTGVHLHFEIYSVANNVKTFYNPAYYI